MTIQGEVKSLFASECKVTSSFTENGKLLLFNNAGILKAFNDENEEPKVYTILDKLTCLAVKDDKYVVTSSTGECKLYNFKSSSEKLLHRSLLPLRAAAFNHDGSIVVVAGDEAELVIINTETQAITQVKVAEEVNNLSYNKANDLLTITLSSGDVLIYSLNSSPPNLVTKIPKITHNIIKDDEDLVDEDNLVATNCEWATSNTDLLLVASPDKSLKLFNRNNSFQTEDKSSFKDHFESRIVDFKISKNNKYVAVLDLKHNLYLLNFKTRRLIKKFKVEVSDDEKALSNLFWSPDNVTVSVSTFGGTSMKFKRVINENEQEEDSVPFGIDQEALEDDENDNGDDLDDDLGNGFEADKIDSHDKYAFEDGDDFIIDDDNAGYTEKRLFVEDDDDVNTDDRHAKRSRLATSSSGLVVESPHYKLKPYCPGSTPWYSDRRYLTMNSIGYAWAVKQDTNSTITVSFFDRSAYKEYHFKDLYGFDLSSMNDLGILFATSGYGKKLSKLKIMFRPHENASETWEKDIPLLKGEFLTSVTVSNSCIIIGSSTGLLRIFNLFGIPLGLEKQSPIIACITNNKYFLTVTYNEKLESFNYNIQDLEFKYFQRDITLPVTIPQSIIRNPKHHFLKGLFFSDDGDPTLVGHDNLVLVLSKWREPLQARWIPILDINDGISQIGGVGDDLKCWPLGLYKNRLNCIIIRGNLNGIYPSFPLPLPTELDIKIPITSSVENNEDEDSEETFIRSKTMSDLLSDMISSAEAEDQYELEQRLLELQMFYDKSLLKIFVSCCNDQNALKAFNVAQEMREDKLLLASVKIAERLGLLGLVRRINELRENRMEVELRS